MSETNNSETNNNVTVTAPVTTTSGTAVPTPLSPSTPSPSTPSPSSSFSARSVIQSKVSQAFGETTTQSTTSTTEPASPSPHSPSSPSSPPAADKATVTAPVTPSPTPFFLSEDQYFDDTNGAGQEGRMGQGGQEEQAQTTSQTQSSSSPSPSSPSSSSPSSSSPSSSSPSSPSHLEDESSARTNFTPEEWSIIEKYLSTPASNNIRSQAKIVREIAKTLGYTPTASDLQLDIQLAQNYRSMVDTFHRAAESSDPNALSNWASFWMFQFQQTPDGQTTIARDPSGVPALRPGAKQAIAKLTEYSAANPETLDTLITTTQQTIIQGLQQNIPHVQQAAIKLAAPYISQIISGYEQSIPNLNGKYFDFKDVNGNDIQLPAAEVAKFLVDILKGDYGYVLQGTGNGMGNGMGSISSASLPPSPSPSPYPPTPFSTSPYPPSSSSSLPPSLSSDLDLSNPKDRELFELRKRAYEQSLQQTLQSQHAERNHLQQLTGTLQSTIIKAIADDVLNSIKDLQSDASGNLTAEANLLKTGMENEIRRMLAENQTFRNRYQQGLIDLRNGIPLKTVGPGVLRAAREAYQNWLLEQRAALLRSRANTQATIASQNQQAIQSTLQNAGNATTGLGRTSATPGSEALSAAANPNASPSIQPGESRADYIRRVVTQKLAAS